MLWMAVSDHGGICPQIYVRFQVGKMRSRKAGVPPFHTTPVTLLFFSPNYNTVGYMRNHNL